MIAVPATTTGRKVVDGLEETVRTILLNLDRYRESVSIIITTNDRQARLLHNGIANARGEEILATIQRVNASAGLMVERLRASDPTAAQAHGALDRGLGRGGRIGLRADPRVSALVNEPALHLAAARHRIGDPRRPLLPPAHRCAPRRDRSARHALQPHGRAPPGPRPADSREDGRDRAGEPPAARTQRNPRGEGPGAHARPPVLARADQAHQHRARGFQAPA